MKFLQDPDFFRPRFYWSLLGLLTGGVNFFQSPQFWNLSPLTGKIQGALLFLSFIFLISGNLFYKPLRKGLTFLLISSVLSLFNLLLSFYHVFQSIEIPYLIYLDILFFIFILLATYSHYKDKRRVEQVDRFWNN